MELYCFDWLVGWYAFFEMELIPQKNSVFEFNTLIEFVTFVVSDLHTNAQDFKNVIRSVTIVSSMTTLIE